MKFNCDGQISFRSARLGLHAQQAERKLQLSFYFEVSCFSTVQTAGAFRPEVRSACAAG